MKRGVTIEYDFHEDCYIIRKARGTLTLEEIQQALNDKKLGGATDGQAD